MPCYYPILIKNKRYENASSAYAAAMREPRYLYVPCGNCMGCLKKKRQDWSVRLSNELRNSLSAYVVTLTYDEENVPWTHKFDTAKFVAINSYLPPEIPTLKYKDIQNWKKLLRTNIDRKLKNNFQLDKLKFFVAPEYGGQTGRPHYHVMVFNWPENLDFFSYVSKTWKKGMFMIDTLDEATIQYCCKYVLKPPKYYKEIGQVPPRSLPSPGLGKSISNKLKSYYRDQLLSRKVIRKNGYTYAVPRCYRDELLNEVEKNRMATDYIKTYQPPAYKFSRGQLLAIDDINQREINKLNDNL